MSIGLIIIILLIILLLGGFSGRFGGYGYGFGHGGIGVIGVILIVLNPRVTPSRSMAIWGSECPRSKAAESIPR